MLFSPEQTLLREAQPLNGAEDDYDGLLDLIGDASVVMLGEASHGTHEFYRERVRITRRLIEELGFVGVAVEADWPDAYRVNRHVRGAAEDADAEEALRGFRRFPTWMWRNAEVLDFVGWLRAHNERAASAAAPASSASTSTASTPRSTRWSPTCGGSIRRRPSGSANAMPASSASEASRTTGAPSASG